MTYCKGKCRAFQVWVPSDVIYNSICQSSVGLLQSNYQTTIMHLASAGKVLPKSMSQRPNYKVLFEDAFIIALTKPYDALSTPGREHRMKPISRADEWAESIVETCLSKRIDPSATESYISALETLKRQAKVVPRHKEKFFSMLERAAKVKDISLKEQIWNDIVKKDQELHGLDTATLPDHLYSAADFAKDISKEPSIHHVHRLDQETSGVIVFAKSSLAASILASQFRDRKIEKTYIALVHGILPEDSPSLIDVPLSADLSCKPKQKVDWTNEGKSSQTIVEKISPDDPSFANRLRYFPPISENLQFSMVKLKPLTGRTHQLRVHMLHLGHPMLGDSLYSEHCNSTLSEGNVSRLCLHAESIQFMHPSTNEVMELRDDTSFCEMKEI